MAFWGDLESPVSRQNSVRRNSSDDRSAQQSQYPPQQSAQTRPNRISMQSQAPTVSTQSPFVSPTASSFKGDGLAPRPPSFPYGVPGAYNKDYLDKRRRRASRETEDYYGDNSAPPPAAPDVPRFPPPVNYKQPYSSAGPPARYPLPVTSRSTRRPEGPVDANPARTTDSYPDERVDTKSSGLGAQRGKISIDTDYQGERTARGSVGGAIEAPRDYPDKGVIRRGTVGARKEKPEYHDPAPPPRSRQASAVETEAQRRREWAPDRSPLQRLELTLDSITKEEKRARVEEAELLAREAKAGRGGDRLNQNSVRFRNRPVVKTEMPGPPEPQSLAEVGLVRSLSNKQRDELQRSGTVQRKKPVIADSAPDRQLGRGFEYQPQQDTISVVREPQKSSVLQRDTEKITRVPEKSSVPQRGPSFRDRTAIPTAAVAVAGAAFSRSTSNKLKKQPPGDPWFSRRQEAERAYPEITQRRPSVDARRDPDMMSGGPLGSAPVNVSARKVSDDIRKEISGTRTAPRPTELVDHLSDEDFPQAAPVRRNPSSKIAQLTGYPIRNGMPRPMSPAQEQLYKDRLGFSEEIDAESSQPGSSQTRTEIKTVSGIKYAVAPEVASGTYGQERVTRRPAGRHNISNIINNRRSQYRPGDGLYAPHQPLEEWKNGTTAALTGALLDLEARHTEAEKDTAWWEAGHSGKRRTSSSKKPKIETYDGEYENTNGMIFPNLFDLSEENYAPFVSVIGAQTWSNIQDPVVPRARHTITIGCKGNRKVETHRRIKFWPMKKKAMLIRPRPNLEARDPLESISHLIISPYSSNCPNISKHNIFHPFHVCPQYNFPEASKLTPAMRLIRVPTIVPTLFNPPLYLKCGPLLRYCGMRRERIPSRQDLDSTAVRETWRGSVMIVTTDSHSADNTPPTLRLFAQPMNLLPPPPDQVDGEASELASEYVDPIAGLTKIGRDGRTLYVRPVEHLEEEKDISRDETDNGLFESQKTVLESHGLRHDGNNDPKIPAASRSQKLNIDGEKVGKYVEVRGLRLHAEQGVTFWRFIIEVELRDQQQRIAYRINRGPATGFWVPARGQSMNIMFHSCNGFSLSVNPDQFSGPDPMWRDVLNTHQTRPFHVMIGGGDQIYNDVIMENTKLFSHWLNVKNPIEKHNAPFTPQMQEELETIYLDRYSMWFSQGLFGLANSQIPMVNIFDDHDIIDGYGSYPHSFMDAPVFAGLGAIAFKYYMLFQHQSVINEGEETEPSWLLGARPGPYIKELSRSVFMSLGSHIAFLGLDCRTEREQDTVLTDATYTKIFDRMHEQIIRGETKHLIVLLGIPIAYPRLVWLENILTSRLMDPIKAIGRAPMFGNLISTIDGGVEVLDDLNDHWTAKNHKKERRLLIEDLQDLAAEKSIRVTILSGDVHLAAIGQFFSNPKLRIPKHQDFRYMPNIISSAIVNTPPPNALADILNRRNKIHHLDNETDEDMIPLFTKDVNGANRNNKRLLPRRNWCSIREYDPELTPPTTPSDERSPSPPQRGGLLRRLSSSRGPSYRPDVGPPLSRGLMRNFSLRGRSSEDSERPGTRQRTLSLSRSDFLPGNLFRRRSKRNPDDGGINGYGASSEEDEPIAPQLRPPKLRGGAGDETFYPPVTNAPFSRTRISRNAVVRDDGNGYTAYDDTPEQRVQPRHQHVLAREPQGLPFHRTPTGLSEKQLRKLGDSHDMNLEGGLDICLNVEVSQKDPAGITMPYRLLVPALWYEDEQEDQNGTKGHERKVSGLMRLVSIGRNKTDKSALKGKGREENGAEEA